jgi:hypothetical protein
MTSNEFIILQGMHKALIEACDSKDSTLLYQVISDLGDLLHSDLMYQVAREAEQVPLQAFH